MSDTENARAAKPPTISVVIAARNVAPWLESCIASLAAQTYRDFEVVLVDDGSSDETPSMIDHLAEIYPWLMPIHSAHRGVSRARNLAIAHSRGTCIAFLDADDYFHPEHLATIAGIFSSHRPDVAIFNFSYLDGGTETLAALKADYPQDAGAIFWLREFLFTPGFIPAVWRQAYSREFIHEHRLEFPDVEIAEDHGWTIAAIAQARRIFFSPAALYVYRKRPGSATYEKSGEMLFRRALGFAGAASHLEHTLAMAPSIDAACRKLVRWKIAEATLGALADILSVRDPMLQARFLRQSGITCLTTRLVRNSRTLRQARRAIKRVTRICLLGIKLWLRPPAAARDA